MDLADFIRDFPGEASCKAKFKAFREQAGVACPKCGSREHYWKSDKEMYECKHCGYRQGLKTNTAMHKSKLPFRYWFLAMHLLTSAKKSFSAAELQRQLGHKRYHPVWHLSHKLRTAMGLRDGEYVLAGRIELDEGYFSTGIPAGQKDEPLERGRGSQVLLMAESEFVENPKPGKKPRRAGYLKMKVIDDLQKETIDGQVQTLAKNTDGIDADDSTSYVDLKDFVPRHNTRVIPKEETGEILPWVHIAIGNDKRQVLNTYHNIKPEFLQKYLDEFCYKFNRRYFGEALFGRLLVACVSYKNEFRYIYG
ncbi:MAG: IS1595 family transposase [Dysgonamonadaceae bacterium]|nr:IS1595 family transposase [Dysgonamonadaceae bacterium]